MYRNCLPDTIARQSDLTCPKYHIVIPAFLLIVLIILVTEVSLHRLNLWFAKYANSICHSFTVLKPFQCSWNNVYRIVSLESTILFSLVLLRISTQGFLFLVYRGQVFMHRMFLVCTAEYTKLDNTHAADMIYRYYCLWPLWGPL